MAIFKNFKIYNNELCPCKSGKKYKECCKIKPTKTFPNEKASIAFIHKLFRKSLIKTCVYDGCAAKAKDIIDAHAMQENKILIQLCENDEVYMLPIKEKHPEILSFFDGTKEPIHFLELIHKKNATVQNCFCSKHDNNLFAIIEKAEYPFRKDNIEQLFMFAYRTFAFEYYKARMMPSFFSKCCKEIPQLMKVKKIVFQYRQAIKKNEELEHYKSIFDNAIKSKDFSQLETYTLELPYNISFANYCSIAPVFCLDGKSVWSIKNGKMKRLFISVFPDNGKSYVLISVFKQDMDVYKHFFDCLRNSNDELLIMYLNAILPFYSENMIISPRLWDFWNNSQRMYVNFMVSETSFEKHLIEMQKNFIAINRFNYTVNQDTLDNMKVNLFKKIR